MLSSDRSYRTISITLLADGVLFALITMVSFISRSESVFSEGLYQLSDLASGGLLVYAIWSSLRPADELHPFGYGMDRFFWSFVSGVFVFSVNGAVSILIGVFDAFNGHPVRNFEWSVLVLMLTVGASSASFAYILARNRKDRKARPDALRQYHQGIRTLMLQDMMSIVSSGVALVALGLVFYTKVQFYDAAGAIVNGVLLLVTGLVLSSESRGLLLGRGLNRSQMTRISSALQSLPNVNKVRELKTIYLGPESLLVVVRVNFRDGLTTDELEQTIDMMQSELGRRMPELKHVIVEPES